MASIQTCNLLIGRLMPYFTRYNTHICLKQKSQTCGMRPLKTLSAACSDFLGYKIL